jgi:hypothetical protein
MSAFWKELQLCCDSATLAQRCHIFRVFNQVWWLSFRSMDTHRWKFPYQILAGKNW